MPPRPSVENEENPREAVGPSDPVSILVFCSDGAMVKDSSYRDGSEEFRGPRLHLLEHGLGIQGSSGKVNGC